MSKEHINYLRRKTADEAELWAADRIEAQQKRIDELERKNKQLFDEHHYQACLTHDLLPYQERAVKAEQHLAATIDILEQTRVERDEWKARAEFSYRQRDELEREIERKMSAAAFVLKERDALIAAHTRLREAINRQHYTMDREVCEALAATEPK